MTMTNLHRGDITGVIGGVERTLRLTLGALADLEAAFGAEDLGDLAARFASGKLKARDAVRVIAAGLRGAGEPVTDQEVAAMPVPGGAAGYADLVVRLLAATFGGPEPATGEGAAPGPLDPASPGPFPGTT
jgi:hypothetical protein